MIIRCLAFSVFAAMPLLAQAVVAPFATSYQVINFGPIPNIGSYGGTAFVAANPSVLLVAPYGHTNVYAVPVTRDAQNHVNGFAAPIPVAAVGGCDGGLAFGSTGVLFATWYGPNRLSQIKPGSSSTDRFDDLGPLGVTSSVGACTFVPAGLPGAGRFKVCGWGGSDFHDLPLTPDGAGTFAPGTVNSSLQLTGGIEGLVYVPAGAPVLGGMLLTCEWGSGIISAYQLDAIGDPLPATRQVVVAGAYYPGGGAVDPVTGDIAFLDAHGSLVVLRTGTPCGPQTGYGIASPGALGTPAISGTGCANLGQAFTLHLSGPQNGIGLLAYGITKIDVPFLNLTILQTVDSTLLSILSPLGTQSIPVGIPNTPSLGNAHLYMQTAYLDASTASGLSASAGLDVWIR